MKLEIGFGNRPQPLELPDANVLGVLYPNEVPVGAKGRLVVEEALRKPLGTPKLSEIVQPGEKIVVITSDVTRPVPSYKILPAVLAELWAAGAKAEDITVVFALGSHRRQTLEEMKKLVGEEVYNKVRCIDGDPTDFVHMGETKLGTPVDITRIVAEADRRVGIGNIDYH